MSKNKVNFTITSTNEIRLDQAISSEDFCPSRARAQEFIQSKLVLVNASTITKPSFKVKKGDIVEVLMPSKKQTKLVGQNIPLDIFYEDQDVLVINKPAGMVVHPSHGHDDMTLVNALLYHCKDLSVGFEADRPGIVHRIDKDTSGLLVVAKNDKAHHSLSEQFQSKTVHRIYWAICFGVPPKTSDRIETYIQRDDKDRKRFQSSDTSGKNAITHYNVLKTYNDEISLLQLRLETGRTHQIRVHLKHIGCPIIADWTYANTKRLKNISSLDLRKKIEGLNRFALHAAELGFTHPTSGEQKFFRVSPPNDLLDILIFCKFIDLVQ